MSASIPDRTNGTARTDCRPRQTPWHHPWPDRLIEVADRGCPKPPVGAVLGSFVATVAMGKRGRRPTNDLSRPL